MNPHTVRSEADLRLAKTLSDQPVIARLMRQLAADESAHGTRRSLLATALRLTRRIEPRIFGLLDAAIDTLDVETEVELYVFASPQFNAACTRPEGGRVFVLLSSSLAEAFADDELAYVIGHELGHHIYDHHALPVHGLTPESGLTAELALQIRSWQRYAEISADRAGLLCCQGLQPAARALYKLSSGFSNAPSESQVTAYLEQASELYREVDAAEPVNHRDWLATHPFSPVRLKAAEAFCGSGFFVDGGDTLDAVELTVQDLMGLMDPSYLHENSDEAEAMRQVLFAGGVLVADAVDGISKEERAALESLLGPKRVPQALNAEALRSDLPYRMRKAVERARRSRRAQVVRDLAIIAQADGNVDNAEVAVMMDIAKGLEVDPSVIHQALRTPVELD